MSEAKAKVRSKSSLKDTPLPPAALGVMNRHQVCQALGGISTRQLSRLISTGSFFRPDLILGESPRWSVARFNAWVEERRQKPAD